MRHDLMEFLNTYLDASGCCFAITRSLHLDLPCVHSLERGVLRALRRIRGFHVDLIDISNKYSIKNGAVCCCWMVGTKLPRSTDYSVLKAQQTGRLDNEHLLPQLKRNELYQFITTSLLKGIWHEESGQAWTPTKESQNDDELSLLSDVAFALLKNGKQQFSSNDLISALRDAYQIRFAVTLSESRQKELLHRVVDQSGLLIRIGIGTRATFLFLHLTVQEYLTAKCLAGMEPADRLNSVAKLW